MHAPRHQTPWTMLWILVIAQFLMSVGAYAWGPLAPFLIDSLGISRAEVGFITSSMYVVATVIAIPGGILVDRFGSYRTLIVCLVFSCIPFLLMGFMKSYATLLALAAVSGVGYGLINQTSTRGLMNWFPPQKRATVMGIKQTGVSLGAALAAVIFPISSLHLAWPLSLAGTGIALAIITLVAAIYYRDQPDKPEESTTSTTLPPKHTNPVKLVWQNKPLLIVIFIFPFLAFAQISITSFLLLFLTESHNMSLVGASACLTITLISGTLGRLIWGTLADRVFNNDILKACILLSIGGCIAAAAITYLPTGTPISFFYIISAIAGFTLIGWNAALMALVAELAGLENVGSVMGVAITIGWTGIFVAPPIFGFIADTAGYTWSWLLVLCCAIVSLAGFVFINFNQPSNHLKRI